MAPDEAPHQTGPTPADIPSGANQDEEQEMPNEANSSQTTGSPAASDEADAALRAELKKATERADDLAGRWQRTQADFINYKRRADQERDQLTKFANLSLIAHILPVLDDFERAMATLPKELYELTWLQGVALIQRKLQYILEQEGLKPIEAAGKDFDPTLHEAVTVEEGVLPHEGKIVVEYQRGYKVHDRVLRPALVKVGREAAAAGSAAEGHGQGDMPDAQAGGAGQGDASSPNVEPGKE